MKVTRNTPEQLIIDHFSIVLAIMMVVFFAMFVGVGAVMVQDGVFWGVLFLGTGILFGGIMLYHTERVQVILDRSSGLLTIRRRNILRYRQVTHDLDALGHAILETSTSGEYTYLTHRAIIVLTSCMSSGEHPITEVYTSASGPKIVADAINDWLGNEITAVR